MNGRELLVMPLPRAEVIFKGMNQGADRAGEASQKKRFWLKLQIDHEVQSGMCRRQIMLNDTDLPKHPENPDMRAFHASMSSFRSTKQQSVPVFGWTLLCFLLQCLLAHSIVLICLCPWWRRWFFFSLFLQRCLPALYIWTKMQLNVVSETLSVSSQSASLRAWWKQKHDSLSDHRARAPKTPHAEAKCKLYLSVLHILGSEFRLCFSSSVMLVKPLKAAVS